MTVRRLARFLPILVWGRAYDGRILTSDLTAAVIVTIMLVPQSLAYALLAGLPPEAGLYASVVPILLYTLFGTSGALAVGPVAVVSLMTAAAIGKVAAQGSAEYAAAALTLAALSGAMLLAFGLLRLGFIANFLSHPVIAGFISASGILIAASQMKHVLGIDAGGHDLPAMLMSLASAAREINRPTLVLGASVCAFLFWVRKGLKPRLLALGLSERLADTGARAGPVLAVVASTLVVWAFELDAQGVAIVGEVPRALPPLTVPTFSVELVQALLVPAALISLVGFVESISVARTLAAKRRERIDPDQELIGLGAANVGAALSGGFPVTGGFSRSVVNFDAGARTPAAGAFTAAGLALAALLLTPLIHYLPKATLGATIIVAVLSLVDLDILARTWRYSRADFAAVLATLVVTLLAGVELGIVAGLSLSLSIFLYRTSRPHVAEVGLVPGTEHFRNVLRHSVITDPTIVALRVDESLYFANAAYLEDRVQSRVIGDERIRHVVLLCSAVNEIDMSALESLEMIDRRLRDLGIELHLSEIKGPVMDRLRRSSFLDDMSGQVFLSHHDAVRALGSTHDHPVATGDDSN